MPIVELRDQDLEQQCAVCGATRSVPLAELSAGVEIAPEMIDPSVIALPTCARCSAREFLVRTPGQEANGKGTGEGLPSDRHRQLVRDLHATLIRVQRHLRSGATEIHNPSP